MEKCCDMATLYLHIGTPKTGTTALQSFCLENRAALLRKGYSFMRSPYYYPDIMNARNGHFLIQPRSAADGSIQTERGRRQWKGGMDAVSAQFRRVPNVILSDEGIWNADQNGIWRDLKEESQKRGFDVRVIVYLRPQDQFLSSRWGQQVKYPIDEIGRTKFDELLPSADEWTHLDYYEMLEGISSQFGRERVIARIYDRECFPDGDVVKDFLSILQLPPDGDFRYVQDRNSSIYGNALEIKRVLNTIPGVPPEAHRLALKIARQCTAQETAFARRSLFSPEERAAFMRRYEESNRRLARDYFGDERLVLFPPVENPPPKWDPNSPEMYETIIRFFGIAAFAKPRDRFIPWVKHELHLLHCAVARVLERAGR